VKIDGRTSIETLGSSKNPFAEAMDEFFAEGDRGRQLEELRHLARWSRRLLAVTGERGVGKSTLYRALSSRLDPGVKAARINANLTSDTREILAGIIQGFGMAAPANADPRLLIELIALHVQEQIDASRYCLVLIDDAHLLELRALEQLLNLVDAGAQEGLRIVFFAEAYFVQSLDKAAKRSEQGQSWHEIRLSPYSDEESRRYIAFRLAAAGQDGRPSFTPNQLSVIVGGSSGLPGRIDELASAILKGDLRIHDEHSLLPRMHRALAVLVLIGAGMGWLIFYNYESPSTVKTVKSTSQAVEAPAADGAASVVDRGKSTLALAVPPRDPSANQPTPPRGSDATRNASPPTSAGASSSEPLAAAPKMGETADVTALTPAKPEPVQGSNSATALTTSRADPSKPTTAELARLEAVKLDAPPPEPANAELRTPATAQKPSVSNGVARKPAVATVPLSSSGEKPRATVSSKPQSAQWLRQQPAAYFTLQLFATTSREKRDAFVGQQEHPDRFATFETKRNGEPWYAVTYGAYATQAEAKSAAATLPSSIGKVQPWIRTFASVQATLE
jgi:DamX protein